MAGQLLTAYFLSDGIKETDEWRACVDDAAVLDALRDAVSGKFKNIGFSINLTKRRRSRN